MRLALAGAVGLMLAGCRSTPPVALPPVDPVLAVPSYPAPAPNGYEAMSRLQALVNREHEPRGDVSTGQYVPPTRAQELAAAPAQLRDNRAALHILRTALQQQWLCPPAGEQAALPAGLSEMRYLGQLLTWEAALLDQRGQNSAAADRLVEVLKLSVKLPRGADSDHRACGWACRGMAFAELRSLIARHRLSETRLRYLARQLRDLERQETPLRESIAVDYHQTTQRWLAMGFSEFQEHLRGDRRALPWFMRATRWLPQGKRVKDRFVVERLPGLMAWDAQLARLSTEPYYKVRDRLPTPPPEHPTDLVDLGRLPVRILEREALHRCYLRALRLMVTLELDYLGWGQYTRRLDLVDELTVAQRQDPFSGRDFRYRKREKSYLLYSAGPDGQDNGGQGTHCPQQAGSDIVLWGEKPAPARAR